jgi:type VI secretion system protein ImpL
MSALARIGIVPSDLLTWVPILLLGVVAGLLAVKWVRARRKKKTAAPPPARPFKARLDLRRAWRTFLRRTPALQRRGLALFQPFVVLGDAGAGKSALVSRFVDWRGRSAQFQPSYVADPLLQIYRGAQVLVQELSATVLEDTSAEASRALVRLWRPLRGGRVPRVVIAIDVARLRASTPDQLVRLAQLLRGKLDLLAAVVRRPVEATLVVTHADQLDGFLELSSVLRAQGKALRIDLGRGDGVPDLESAFASFEQYLPLVQAHANAASYLKVLSFFQQLPSLQGPLDTFVRMLRRADAQGPAPVVCTVALSSCKEDGDSSCNPFAATLTAGDVQRFRPLRKHVILAASVAAVGVVYQVAGYQAARLRIEESSRRLDALLETPADPDAQAAWLRGVTAERDSPARHFFPAFFSSDRTFGEAEVRRRFVHGVRARLLTPRLEAGRRGRLGQGGLHALTLLHASGRSALGKLVLTHAGQWSEELSLPAGIVRDYLEAADRQLAPARDATARLPEMVAAQQTEAADVTRFVAEVQRKLAQPYLSAAELQQLKALAAPVRKDAQALAREQTLATAVSLLKDETGIEVGDNWRRAPTLTDAAPAAIEELVALVEASRIDTPAARVDLAALVGQLKELADSATPRAAPPIAVIIDGRRTSIDAAAWDRLLVRSRAAQAVHVFASAGDGGPAVLFADPNAFAPIQVNAQADGCAFGNGGRVEGVYTVQALGEHVLPLLTQLPDILTKLPLRDADKQQFGQRVTQAVSKYADDYAAQYAALIGQLRCRARSAQDLRYLLGQLQGAGSPLRAALREVTRNTTFTLPADNPFSAPLAKLVDQFAPLRTLSPLTGPTPQVDAWAAIVRGMQGSLDGRAPAAGAAPGDKEPEDGLRARLSPLGRMALSMYRRDEDSQRLQVERWLAAANVDSAFWAPFLSPVEETYALGRRELQEALSDAWNDLLQAEVQPLSHAFPFRRDAEFPAGAALIDGALAPKQSFWSAFEARVAPVLTLGRDGWHARETKQSLVPPDLLSTVNRMRALTALLYDQEGKPRPLVVRVRPLPLSASASALLASYMQAAGTTFYGFNQRVEWVTLKIEWWKADTAAVGVALGGAEGARNYRSVTVMDTPWSLWRLLSRATESARVFTWQVPGPDGRLVPVQFELKDDPWTSFAVR